MLKTLNEVVSLVGLSRRVIQEYEKAGILERPRTTNRYGHLLYDDQAIARLWQIRFYREIDYDKVESEKGERKYDKNKLKKIFLDPDFDERKTLAEQIEKLEIKRKKLDELINTAKTMQEAHIGPSQIHALTVGYDTVTFDRFLPILTTSLTSFAGIENEDIDFESIWSEREIELIQEAIISLVECWNDIEDPSSENVQRQLMTTFSRIMKTEKLPVIPINWVLPIMKADRSFIEEINEAVGEGFYEYVLAALTAFSEKQQRSGFEDAIDRIEQLGREKYTTSSLEVQGEVRRLYDYFMEFPMLSEKLCLKLLMGFSNMLGSREYIDEFDRGNTHGISWFISRAIQIFCDERKINEKKEV